MCMLFLFMIYYKCIFIRFHEDKYSMDFFKKKNIKKLKIINNKTINIIYTVLLFIKMNLTDEKSVFFMPFFKNKGASCIIKMWMLKIENTSEYNKTTDWQVSKNLIIQRGIYNEV